MYRSLTTADTHRSPDAVAVALYEKTAELPEAYEEIDRESGGVLAAVLRRADFKPSAGAMIALHPARGPQLYVLGLGPADRFHANHLRAAASRLTPAVHAAKVASVRVHFGPLEETIDHAALAFGEGLGLGAFVFDQFKGAAKVEGEKSPDRLATRRGGKPNGPRELAVSSTSGPARRAIDAGLEIAESVNAARDLAATPPNIANPAYLADYCRKLARETGLRCTVIDAAKARTLKMGGLLAVGGAGSTPPVLICLEWKPQVLSRKSPVRLATRRGEPQAPPVLLVGKAVTFDTGGYSIKPADAMVPMKYDKSGGMAVIGAMRAVAKLRLPVHVVGLVPAAENMIGQTAYRPSDILTLTNGVTVEVNNTDAEGRVVLADALAYGCKTYKPRR